MTILMEPDPETTQHTSMYAMAIEGLVMPTTMTLDSPGEAIAQSDLAGWLLRGMDVWRAVDRHGETLGVRSIDGARALRLLLGYHSGRFRGIEHDTMATDEGVSLLVIAEIRMGIRHRNGDTRRDWR